MKSRSKQFAFIFLSLFISFLLWHSTNQYQAPNSRLLPSISYQSSVTRTASVIRFCSYPTNRYNLAPPQDIEQAISYRKIVDNSIGIDGYCLYLARNGLINKVVRLKIDQAWTMIKNAIVGLVFFIGTFVLGLVVLLIIWPFLCCCCCACGTSKCCRRQNQNLYTTCELYWPAIVLILALSLSICGAIYGLSFSSQLKKPFTDLACSATLILDDLLNGNVTINKEYYFIGLNQFASQLTNQITSNIDAINAELARLRDSTPNSDMQNVLDASTNALNLIKVIPTNTFPYGPVASTYTTPIDTNIPVSTATYPFSAELGSYLIPGSIVNKMYESINTINSFFVSVKTSATILDSQIGNIKSNVTSTQVTIQSIIDSVNSIDKQIQDFLANLQIPGYYLVLSAELIYGLEIAFSCIALVGVIFTVWCNFIRFRYLMYFSCPVLILIALIGFAIAAVLSFVVPLLTWTCSFIDVFMQTQSGFTTNLGDVVGSSIIGNTDVCMPFGDGKIIDRVGIGLSSGLGNLTSVINLMFSYSPSLFAGYLSGNITSNVNKIQKVADGKIMNMLYSDWLIMSRISNRQNYGSCMNSDFIQDSWVPSNNQENSYNNINCLSTNGHTGTAVGCGVTLSSVPTCSGCMDTASILSYYTSINTSPLTNLNNRYLCASFTADLSNIWTNYYKKMTPIFADVYTRAAAARDGIVVNDSTNPQKLMYNLYNMNSVFADIQSNLSSYSNITDPVSGMLQGLNCKIFGEDFFLMKEIVCGSLYKYLYLLRISLGIISFGILVAICCITCVGVRHYNVYKQFTAVAHMGVIQNTNEVNNARIQHSQYTERNNNQFKTDDRKIFTDRQEAKNIINEDHTVKVLLHHHDEYSQNELSTGKHRNGGNNQNNSEQKIKKIQIMKEQIKQQKNIQELHEQEASNIVLEEHSQNNNELLKKIKL